MGESLERGEALGARLGAAAGHHHELVPLEHARGYPEVLDLGELGAEPGRASDTAAS